MSKQAKRFYEFGPFRLDTSNRLLMREGEVVPLKQKAVETLLVLVEGRGEILEKDELMRRLWPDSFVEESNLTQNIYVLRKALGEGDYIQTVPRRGYRFAAEICEGVDETRELILSERTRASILFEEEEETKEQTEVPVATEMIIGPRGSRRARRRTVLTVTVAAISLVLLGTAAYQWRRGAAEEQPVAPATNDPIKSIAVLPFKSLGAEGDDAYMGVGMTDALITRLSAAGSLIVRPTGSVLRYADSTADTIKAGQELGVDAVLDGSIQRQGERLRVNVRLVRTSDGRPLWAGTLDEQAADTFRLQDTISERVASMVALKLSAEEQKLLAKRYTSNPDAEQLYLKGRYFWEKRTEEGLKKSIECFEQAVAHDPNYALAYTGIADAYIQLPGYGATASMEVYPKAKAAAARALELDPALAEAHNSNAGVLSYFEWDWSAAEAEYRKAVALNPNYAAAHHRLGVQLAAAGRGEEAVAELRRAQQLDPLSLITNSLLGFAYLQAGQDDEGVAQLRRTIEMDANFPPAHELLARAYRERGRTDEAFAEYLEWRRLSGDGAEMLEAYRKAYAVSGLKGFYKRRLDFLLQQSERSRVQPSEVAELYSLLGEREQAFVWLEKAVEQHEGEVVWLKTLSDFEGLRSDARYANLLRRINMGQ